MKKKFLSAHRLFLFFSLIFFVLIFYLLFTNIVIEDKKAIVTEFESLMGRVISFVRNESYEDLDQAVPPNKYPQKTRRTNTNLGGYKLETGVFFGSYIRNNSSKITFKRDGKMFQVPFAEEDFAYGCTNQIISGEEVYFVDKASNVVFIEPKDLRKLLKKGEKIILITDKAHKKCTVVVSNKCDE